MFQALIGTVETSTVKRLLQAEDQFQALIGTVETGIPGICGHADVPFQALIGTVETNGPFADQVDALTVSSPHRYCRNRALPDSSRILPEVSSPHRYCRNRLPLLPTQEYHFQFQALIGTVETVYGIDEPPALDEVSSPHRYCRNPAPVATRSPRSRCFKPS